jgi:hypothetical protein
MIGNVLLWCGAGLNRRHKDFQSTLFHSNLVLIRAKAYIFQQNLY